MRACLLLLVASSIAFAETKYELKGHELVVPHPIVFETGGDTLKGESDDALAYVKGYLVARKDITKLRIEVHTDSQGSDEHNQTMSEKRALAVARALVHLGADCKRLVPVGFGETRPIADNRTADGRAKNRRVTFVNAALRGKAINNAPLEGGGKLAGDPCN